MNEAVAVAKEADTKKESSRVKSDVSTHRVRNEPERQLGSLRDMVSNINLNFSDYGHYVALCNNLTLHK